MIEIPTFGTKKELFGFMKQNEELHIAEKKKAMKKADALNFVGISGKKVEISKAAAEGSQGKENVAHVTAVINTTGILDSHSDVHIPGLWNKSLGENKLIKFLQEHVMRFDHVIADKDDLTAYVKTVPWKTLGFDFDGNTEALIFEADVKASRNKSMLAQYKDGHVDQHSVGMQYVKIVLCVNDEDYGANFEAWEKYFPMVANKEEAERKGYFWAVTEAKVIEGSAVVLGSNYATPTQEIKKPSEDTSKTKPAEATSTEKNIDIINNFKLH